MESKINKADISFVWIYTGEHDILRVQVPVEYWLFLAMQVCKCRCKLNAPPATPFLITFKS